MQSSSFRAALAARFFAAGALLATFAGCGTRESAASLPVLDIDPDRVAVAGLSSGAYMATQAHLALGERIGGAALVAGGPYGCAGGDLATALGPCMKAAPRPPDLDALLRRVRERAAAGRLAALQSLAGDRVFVLHGADDAVVAPALASATAELYRRLGEGLQPPLEVQLDAGRSFGHTLPTLGRGGPCMETVAPFLGDCGFDAAGAVFAALFGAATDDGAAAAPGAEPAAGGELLAFDQRALVAADGNPQLADQGFVYLPPQCRAGRCGLLVVFHGCEQNADHVGEAFVREAGFNGWADRHDVVVLYPQTRASYAPLNPKACWDWWGYTGDDYDTRDGAQLRWLQAALQAIGLPAPSG
jgi:hypothetical protein